MKNHQTFLGRSLSLLLVVVLALALSVSAFAADNPDATGAPAKYNPSASITVGKTLSTNEKGVWPAVTSFDFTLTPVSYNAGPDLTTAGTTYTSYTAANLPMPEGTAAGGTTTVTVGTFSHLANSETETLTNKTADITYTQTGVYTYRLVENVPAAADRVQGVTYDESVYFVNVYVTNVLHADGTPVLDANGYALVNVSNITAYQTTNGALDPMAADNGGAAADPNDDDGKIGITTPATDNGDPRTISYPFVNTYSASDLAVSKKVAGTLADPQKLFSFTIAIYKADGTTAETNSFSYKIYNMGNDEKKEGNDDVQAGADGTITNGDTFTLKHNQYIVIKGLPDGEVYNVTEQGAADYNTTIATQNGTTADAADPTLRKTAGNKTLVTTAGSLNTQDFLNTKNAITPTGIILNAIPYVLIVCAAAGFIVVMVVKKRRVTD